MGEARHRPRKRGEDPRFRGRRDTTPTGTNASAYTYDPTGNTTTRTLHGDKQTLTWDPEGHLSRVTEPTGDKDTKTTSYLYDAYGNRLITRTDTKTTLTLGDHTEVTLDKGSDTPKATRCIPLGGGNQAVLTDDGTYTVTLADHQGTGQLAVSTADQTLVQRRALPFGGPRGTQPRTWPGTKGFVGGTNDTTDTGLTHLGAREYDPDTGRFLSVDPVMDLTDPQQINGYTYSNNNPTTFSDPDGKLFADPDGSGRGYGVVQNKGGGMRLSTKPNWKIGPRSCIQPYCGGYSEERRGSIGGRASAAYRSGLPGVSKINPLDPSEPQIIALWALGAAPTVWQFWEGDAFTEDVKNMDWIWIVKAMLANLKGKSVGDEADANSISYHATYAADLYHLPVWALPAFDGIRFTDRALGMDSAGPAAAQAILGSYTLRAQFDSYDAKTQTAGVTFTLKNPMTRTSATRDPSASGYEKGEGNPLLKRVSEMGLDFAPGGQKDAFMAVHWRDQIKMRHPLNDK
ncbi:RHS repeat domain-containing protein [Streptomyces sp. NPDC014733]|uniref:RHS repeat domain-containing protein n=1 Tax=Streptomyces sp. NPDC014733 TaxID=3364885 RepID=UPI0037033C28